jgi:hypothetical protein
MRYVHPNDADMREAMEKARGAATPVQSDAAAKEEKRDRDSQPEK